MHTSVILSKILSRTNILGLEIVKKQYARSGDTTIRKTEIVPALIQLGFNVLGKTDRLKIIIKFSKNLNDLLENKNWVRRQILPRKALLGLVATNTDFSSCR